MEERTVTRCLAPVRRVLYTGERRFSDPETVPDDFNPECRVDGVLPVLAKRLTTYMLPKKYIDTSVQKENGFPDAMKHTSVLTQLIKEAKAT